MKQPKYKFGEQVEVELVATTDNDVEIKAKKIGYITSIFARPSTDRIKYHYEIREEPPKPYCNLTKVLTTLREENIIVKTNDDGE